MGTVYEATHVRLPRRFAVKVWENPTDDYVLPGPLTSNEMCNQGIIGHPAASARCLQE